MENFYIVSNDCETGKAYWKHIESVKQISKAFNEFATEHKIEAEQFIPRTERLKIIPLGNDFVKFKNEFLISKPGVFKVSSKTNKAWVQRCKDKGLEYIEKPFVPFLFNFVYKCKYRLFDVDNVIYCTFDGDIDDIETPNGFTPIKGSRFYEIMEYNNIAL